MARSHHSTQASVRAQRLDYQARTKQGVVPGNLLFPFMLRHACWCDTRFEPKDSGGLTCYESKNGQSYKSSLVSFGEAVMFGVPIDSGMRKKLEVQ